MQTHRFFSHIFSPDRISQPEKRHQFSYKTFREDEQNAVCTILAYKKRGKYQPGKVMRENPPVLPLSIHNAAKSFLRTAKSILRNVTELSNIMPVIFQMRPAVRSFQMRIRLAKLPYSELRVIEAAQENKVDKSYLLTLFYNHILTNISTAA